MAATERKLRHARVQWIAVEDCLPSPENDDLYRPINTGDSEFQDLVASVRENGILEPLVLTSDRPRRYILSGHRRHAAALAAGLDEVPYRAERISRKKDRDGFVKRLREYNRQRLKTRDERIREAVVDVDPEEAYQSLIAHRTEQGRTTAKLMEIKGEKKRCRISDAKRFFLEAIQQSIQKRREFWPLSDRTIHYDLLNDPPLKHASKPESVYDNTAKSYDSLTELLTRARLEGLIPWEAIGDETRPVVTWNVFQDIGVFVKEQFENFLKGYWRNLLQSQPHHIEIVGEKNTILPIIKPVAAEFCIPFTLGRGYSSLDPRKQMFDRFQQSGKARMFVLFMSDCDPDGDEISHSFARSMRDDFGIADIQPVRVALTREQVREHNLPPIMQAKRGSAHYDKFLREHQTDTVFELEALPPEVLQASLRSAIDSVIDRDAFNAELDAEKKDAAALERIRRKVHQLIGELDLEDDLC